MESERDAWCGFLPRKSSPKFYLTRFWGVGQETTKSEAYCVPRLSQVPLIPESNPLLVKKWGDVKSFSFPSPIWELLCNYQLLGNNHPYYYIKAQEIRVTKKGISQTLWAWIFFGGFLLFITQKSIPWRPTSAHWLSVKSSPGKWTHLSMFSLNIYTLLFYLHSLKHLFQFHSFDHRVNITIPKSLFLMLTSFLSITPAFPAEYLLVPVPEHQSHALNSACKGKRQYPLHQIGFFPVSLSLVISSPSRDKVGNLTGFPDISFPLPGRIYLKIICIW